MEIFANPPVTDIIDTYRDYIRVDRPEDLIGPGDRLYIETTDGPDASAPALRMVKLDRAVVARRKNIINMRNGKLILDAVRNPYAVDYHLANRRPEEKPVLLVDEALHGPYAFHLDGYNYSAVLRHMGYGHFLVEGMSQLWGALRLDVSQMRVLVNYVKPNFSQDIASALFGDRVHRLDKPGLVDNLIVASRSLILSQIAPCFWDVADRIAGPLPEVRRGRFYVSRKLAHKRRLVDYEAVEHEFRRRGFQILHPEKMSTHQQIETFRTAEWIAGEAGSGLYNVAFAPPDVRRMILSPDKFFSINDATLSRDHAPIRVFGTSIERGVSSAISDWTIDPAYVRARIREHIPPPAA